MKTYIGTKQVMAEPMNELTAVEKGYARPNEDNHEWRQGYHVQYTNPDGSTYDSWSPKDVFEVAYKCTETPLDRMKIEHDELGERLQKLLAFLETEKFKSLDEVSSYLLCTQCDAMTSYLETLEVRMKLMSK